MKNRDLDFDTKLLVGEFNEAFDPLSKHWVKILNAEINERDDIDIRAVRYSDGVVDHYKQWELCGYS